MKAPDFDYVRPDSIDQALAVLAEHGDRAQVLAGGQSLLAMLNLRLSSPDVLVDIGGLPGLRSIEVLDDHVRIGALVTHTQLLESALIARSVPLLAAAVPHVAHLAIRNAGTIGGSLALADPAAEYPAVALALDARLVLRGAAGERRVAAADWCVGLYATARRDDELLVAIEFPVAGPAHRSVFLELARRRGDYAMVGLAAALEWVDGRVAAARFGWLAVGDQPLATPATAAVLLGRDLDQASIEAARRTLAEELPAHGDLHCDAPTRSHLAGVLLNRALVAIASQTGAHS